MIDPQSGSQAYARSVVPVVCLSSHQRREKYFLLVCITPHTSCEWPVLYQHEDCTLLKQVSNSF